jgi:hypothetical protein
MWAGLRQCSGELNFYEKALTYTVSEETYRMVNHIINYPIKINDIVTQDNKDQIYDLLYKGIIHLSSKKSNPKQNQNQKEESLKSHGKLVP